MRSTCSWLDAVVSAACSVRQYFVSWVSSVVLGAVVGFDSDFGVCGLPNFAQNSVALRPDASMARRQTSDAALAAVVLSLAAAYLVRQSFTALPTSLVFVSRRGVVSGSELVSNVVDFAVRLRVTSGFAVGSGLVVGAGDVIGAFLC